MKRYGVWVEEAPTNATGVKVVGTGDDDSTVVVKKKPKIFKRKKRMTAEEIEEVRNYAKERANYHSKPEQMERNAARLRARRLMIKNGKAARGDGKDVHHKDNDPLNNEEDNLKMTSQSWNRREPRLRKEESINILERELTSTELKRREEIAKDLDDEKFKEKYGDKWKQVKMGVATNMAKNESIDEVDDPKADKAKSKELKLAKAIAQTQLVIAKQQEKAQKLADLQQRLKDQQSTAESTMNKKYLNTKQGSIEDVIKQVWQNASNSVQATPPTVEEVKDQEEDASPKTKVDGRTKQYKETLKRISMRKEKLTAMKKSSRAVEHVTDAIDEDNIDEAKFRPADVKKAIKIAYDMEGDMTGAWKKIEKMKRGLGDEPTVQAALQDANEEVVHEAVKGHFDAPDPKRMKKDLAKYRLKGKIVHKDVNPGYDEWEVSGKSIEDVWAWYHKSGYGNKNDFDDMDDFKDTHFESHIHHRAMMTEAVKGYFDLDPKNDAWMKKSTKKHSIKAKKIGKGTGGGNTDEWELVAKDVKTLWNWYRDDSMGEPYNNDPRASLDDFKDTHLESRQHHRNMMTEGNKEEYQKFFQAALKKFGAKSPAEMDDEKKKKFFDYIDKNWTKEEQQEFSEGGLPPALKKAIDAKRAQKKDKEEQDEDPVGKKREMKEGTWAIPDTQAKYDKVMKLMKKPIPAGGADKKYFNTIGDDDVWDEVEKILDKKGPKADIRPVFKKFFKDARIKDYMKKKGIKEEVIAESIAELRSIVDSNEHGLVNEVKVDIHSAKAMVKVFDRLSAGNKLKVEQMLKTEKGINKFAEFAISNLK